MIELSGALVILLFLAVDQCVHVHVRCLLVRISLFQIKHKESKMLKM